MKKVTERMLDFAATLHEQNKSLFPKNVRCILATYVDLDALKNEKDIKNARENIINLFNNKEAHELRRSFFNVYKEKLPKKTYQSLSDLKYKNSRTIQREGLFFSVGNDKYTNVVDGMFEFSEVNKFRSWYDSSIEELLNDDKTSKFLKFLTSIPLENFFNKLEENTSGKLFVGLALYSNPDVGGLALCLCVIPDMNEIDALLNNLGISHQERYVLKLSSDIEQMSQIINKFTDPLLDYESLVIKPQSK